MRRYKKREKLPSLYDVTKSEYLLTVKAGYFPGERIKKQLIKSIIFS